MFSVLLLIYGTSGSSFLSLTPNALMLGDKVRLSYKNTRTQLSWGLSCLNSTDGWVRSWSIGISCIWSQTWYCSSLPGPTLRLQSEHGKQASFIWFLRKSSRFRDNRVGGNLFSCLLSDQRSVGASTSFFGMIGAYVRVSIEPKKGSAFDCKEVMGVPSGPNDRTLLDSQLDLHF